MFDVQVAFQGGGAKLVNMLAVAEVLEKAHVDREINITRVAGTSAGSIVACLLASGTGISVARESLQTKEMREVATSLSKIGRTRALTCVLAGSPILSIEPLMSWLVGRLKGSSPNPVRRTVKAVCAMRTAHPMELLIVSSDLGNRGSRRADLEDDAVKAVTDSCAIPFVFRGWRGGGRVDGGICSNLPVEFLLDRVQEKGEVLAVSFATPPTPSHDGLLKYLMALVDTAISAGEEKARASLQASNVCSIVTDLTTLDFEGAVDKGLGEQYLRIKRDAEDWLQKYLNIRKHRALSLQVDPWADQSASCNQVMSAVGAYFEQIEAGRTIEYKKARLLVVANSLRAPKDVYSGARDFMELQLQFSTADKAIHMMELAVTEMHVESTLDVSSLLCKVTDSQGVDVPATLIPMRLPSTPKDRRVCVCFSTPLAPNSGPYSLRYGIQGTNFMRTLQISREDEVAYYPTRAKGALGTLELLLQVPHDFALTVSERGRADGARRLGDAELPDSRPYGLTTYGFVAQKIEKCDDLWHLRVCLP